MITRRWPAAALAVAVPVRPLHLDGTTFPADATTLPAPAARLAYRGGSLAAGEEREGVTRRVDALVAAMTGSEGPSPASNATASVSPLASGPGSSSGPRSQRGHLAQLDNRRPGQAFPDQLRPAQILRSTI